MSIDALIALGSVDPRQTYAAGIGTVSPAPGAKSFADMLGKAVQEVESLQTQRDDTIRNMIKGDVSEVHDVMVAAEEAQLSFELMLEIRNKLLESYQEIMRTQV